MSCRTIDLTMTISEPTEDAIAAAMVRAENVACRPGNDRCQVVPNSIEIARASCTPKGRCRVGWIPAYSGCDSWDGWLYVHTGKGRLRRRRDRRHVISRRSHRAAVIVSSAGLRPYPIRTPVGR